MPVKMDWIIPGQVLYQRWWGVGTLNDMRWVNETALHMIAQYPDRPLIHSVVNAIGQEKSEGSLSQIRQTYTVLDHPQTGWIVLAIDQPILRFVGNIALQIGTQSRIRFINDIDEWQPFLKERDSTIDWSALDLSVVERLEREITSS